MANRRRTIQLTLSAICDGVTYIVHIAEPETGRTQTIEGVVASSEAEAIERVAAILERNAKAAMGPDVTVTSGPTTYD